MLKAPSIPADELSKITERLAFVATSTTMTAFGLMLTLLLVVGIAGRFKQPAAPASSRRIEQKVAQKGKKPA